MNAIFNKIATLTVATWLSYGLIPVLTNLAYVGDAKATVVFDSTNQPTTFAQLPACTAALDQSKAAITDGPAAPSFGQNVTLGGGTSRDLIMCNGSASTPVWQVYAGVAGTGSLVSQAFVLPAPNQLGGGQTVNGNYATGCSASPGPASAAVDAAPGELKTVTGASVATGQHTCLRFDDHWNGTGTSSSTTALNTSNWAPGLVMCNNTPGNTSGTTHNCSQFYDGTSSANLPLPLTSWCAPGYANGCFDNVLYAYPYGTSTLVSGIDVSVFKPLQRNTADGSLAFGVKYYFPQTTSNGTSGFCTGTSCQWLNWVGSAITTGGINQSTLTIPNLNTIIPVAGGMLQWRMKLDDGLNVGAYPGMQCSALGGGYPDTGANDSNANFEFGYNINAGAVSYPGGTFQNIGLSMNDQPNGSANSASPDITNKGDDGIGTGDLRNWHTFGMEWTGTSGATPNQWHYYVDGIQLTAGTVTEARVPTIGWQCNFSINIGSSTTEPGGFGFHSKWDSAAPGGPYYAYISDWQVYKKPGT